MEKNDKEIHAHYGERGPAPKMTFKQTLQFIVYGCLIIALFWLASYFSWF